MSVADALPFERLVYPKFCGTPLIRLEPLADGVLRRECPGDAVLSFRPGSGGI